MAYEQLVGLSNVQLQARVRSLAGITENILFTAHARERMLERYVSDLEVIEALRCGCIERPFAVCDEHLSIECRMECYVAGRHLSVVVELVDEDPDLLVITVFEVAN